MCFDMFVLCLLIKPGQEFSVIVKTCQYLCGVLESLFVEVNDDLETRILQLLPLSSSLQISWLNHKTSSSLSLERLNYPSVP